VALTTCRASLALLRLQLNPKVNAFQRSFVGDIRRLDEMDRRLRLFSSQIASVTSPAIHVPTLETVPPFITVGPRGPQAIDELDQKLQEHENRIAQMNTSWEQLVKKQRELEEARCVLRETAVFFQQVRRPSRPSVPSGLKLTTQRFSCSLRLRVGTPRSDRRSTTRAPPRCSTALARTRAQPTRATALATTSSLSRARSTGAGSQPLSASSGACSAATST
jgi:uncharacterized coiled-coil protein SlyX